MYTINVVVHTRRKVKEYNLGRYDSAGEASKALLDTVETIEAGLLTGEEITHCEVKEI